MNDAEQHHGRKWQQDFHKNHISQIADQVEKRVAEIESHGHIESAELRRGEKFDELLVVLEPYEILSTDFAKQYELHLREVWITTEPMRLREYMFPKERLTARFLLNYRGEDHE